MTRDQFIEHLKAIDPKMPTGDSDGVHLPVACSFIAAKCFMEERSEDEHTAALRHQLKFLSDKGYFDFEEES